MYRSSARRCPACSDPMDEVTITLADGGESHLDLCPRCGGVFVEFFDGEPVAVAQGLADHLARLPWSTDLPDRPLECPDCAVELTPRRYLDDGPFVLRCESCLAAFATPSQLGDLARHQSFEAEPWLRRLLKTLWP